MSGSTVRKPIEWIEYDGDRDKVLHDIKLHDGTIIPACYPNSIAWNPLATHDRRHEDSEVAFINVCGFHMLDLHESEDLIRDHFKALGVDYERREEMFQNNRSEIELVPAMRIAKRGFAAYQLQDSVYLPDSPNWTPVKSDPERLKLKPKKPYVYKRGRK